MDVEATIELIEVKENDGLEVFETLVSIINDLDENIQLSWIKKGNKKIISREEIITIPYYLEHYYLMYYALLKNKNETKLNVFVRDKQKFTTLSIYPFMLAITDENILSKEKQNNINYLIYKHIVNESQHMLEYDFVNKYNYEYEWIPHADETLEPLMTFTTRQEIPNELQGIYKLKIKNKDGSIDQYIGQSNNIKRRMNDHSSKKFKGVNIVEYAIMKLVEDQFMLNYWELYFLKMILGWTNNNYSDKKLRNVETVSIKRYLQPKPELSTIVGSKMNNNFFKLWYHNFVIKHVSKDNSENTKKYIKLLEKNKQ